MARSGRELAERLVARVDAARDRLRAVPGLRVLEGRLADGSAVEAAKLVVQLAGTGAHGVVVEADLLAAGFPVELADRDTIVAVVTFADDDATVVAFADELAAAVERRRGAPREVVAAAAWTVRPEQVLAPRAAFFAQAEAVPAGAAVGEGRCRAGSALPARRARAGARRADHRRGALVTALGAGRRGTDRLRGRSHAGHAAGRCPAPECCCTMTAMTSRPVLRAVSFTWWQSRRAVTTSSHPSGRPVPGGRSCVSSS